MGNELDNPAKIHKWTGWLLLAIGGGIGIVYSIFGAVTFYDYLRCTNSSCYELLMGPAIASVMATPAFAFAALGAYILKSALPRIVALTVYVLSGFSALVLVYFIFWG